MNLRILLVAAVVFGGVFNARAATKSKASKKGRLPDVELLDQNGKKVRLRSDIAKDKVLAVSFIFTTCPTICPPMGASLGRVQDELGARLDKDVALVSVSINPTTDTPERMKAWGAQFKARSGWSLLTGDATVIDGLLKETGMFTSAIEDHAPLLLLCSDKTGERRRVHALSTPPKEIARILGAMSDAGKAGSTNKKAQVDAISAAAGRRFAGIELTNQHGKKLDLYKDLMKDKVFAVNCFFSTCKGVCTATLPKFAKFQEVAGNRMGNDVHLLSITVDPVHDTPDELKDFAKGLGAENGWHFLSGDKAQVDKALAKLGFSVEVKEAHNNIFFFVNERAGLWKKELGLRPNEELIEEFREVLDHK